MFGVQNTCVVHRPSQPARTTPFASNRDILPKPQPQLYVGAITSKLSGWSRGNLGNTNRHLIRMSQCLRATQHWTRDTNAYCLPNTRQLEFSDAIALTCVNATPLLALPAHSVHLRWRFESEFVKLDEVAVYDQQMTAEQVETLFRATAAAPVTLSPVAVSWPYANDTYAADCAAAEHHLLIAKSMSITMPTLTDQTVPTMGFMVVTLRQSIPGSPFNAVYDGANDRLWIVPDNEYYNGATAAQPCPGLNVFLHC